MRNLAALLALFLLLVAVTAFGGWIFMLLAGVVGAPISYADSIVAYYLLSILMSTWSGRVIANSNGGRRD